MRIVIITDAWFPQVNGVVRTLDALRAELADLGHGVHFITPDQFTSIPCPSYPEIRLALSRPGRVGRMIDAHQPSAIHIATEGPLGLMARRHCLRRGYPFTTAYHTRFPEYIRERWRFVPLGLPYAFMRWFHRPASAVMVATATIEAVLKARGFTHIRRWSRGVDTELFRPRPEDREHLGLHRPIHLYVGRVAVEKNIEAFLALDLAGSKLVVGDGPQLEELRRRHPDVHFAGSRTGEDLARHYAAADVFVFPSRTDTFGLVLIEALAAGVPVAAYPVPGPLDVFEGGGPGALDEDLGRAVAAARTISPARCREFALGFSWRASTRQFLENLAEFEENAPSPKASLVPAPPGGV